MLVRLLPLALLALAPTASAQTVRIPDGDPVMPAVPMSYGLWAFERAVLDRGRSPVDEANRRAYSVDALGRINVEIVGPRGAEALGDGFLAGFGGYADSTWRHRSSAWLSAGVLEAAARALPEGYALQHVLPIDEDGDPEEDFAADCGVTSYTDGGARGAGIRVAVIDSGFLNLGDAQSAGTAPSGSSLTETSYSGSVDAGSRHGTACLETVYDHAWAADYWIYKVANVTHMGNAVDDAISNDVDIITHSISRYNQGWDDDSGDACDAANDAVDDGMLFFTSAGNRAESHWQGNFDGNGNDIHNWSGGDETIDVTLGPGQGGNFYLQWDKDNGLTNFALYLYESDVSTVAEKSASIIPNSYESFYFENPDSVTQTYHLVVTRAGSKTTEFEVFFHGDVDFDEHQMPEGSTTSPSNTIDANVISCAAVKWDNWTLGNGTTGIIQSYSSNGPSNDGRTLPDIAGATGNYTIAYSDVKTNGGFGGTSCATPNLAGIAASFWSEFDDLNADAVRYLLFEQASIFRDWGDSGKDDVYGEGGVFLYEYHDDTLWMDDGYLDWVTILGGLWNESSMIAPFRRVEDALKVAQNGGRLLFLGGSYPETFSTDVRLTWDTIGSQAVVGE